MTAAGESGPRIPLPAALRIRRWPVWRQSARILGLVLSVELATAAVTAALLDRGLSPSVPQLTVAAVLVVAGVVHAEWLLEVERARRRIAQRNNVDLTSVWTFAGVLVLPAVVAGLVAVVVYCYFWRRAWRLRTPLYRHLYSTATIVLGCFASHAVFTSVVDAGGARWVVAPAVVLALLTYTTVNNCLVAVAVALSNPAPTAAAMFASWDENLVELASLCLGALAAAALLIDPWLIVAVAPPLVALHRAALIRQLREAASTDAKTGLLNAAAWHHSAEAVLHRGAEDVLRRVRRRPLHPRGVLLIDLDRFKLVNDAHGHVAGDHALAAVASALRAEVRGGDLVGRFGGEEFVVLLTSDVPGPAADTLEVAHRIRRRIESLCVDVTAPGRSCDPITLSASIGVALVDPNDPGPLSVLMQAADGALFAAKHAGRNRVHVGAGPVG